MRVVWFSWRDIGNPRAGGAEIISFEHARRWVQAGNDVTLFTAHYRGAPVEQELDGVRIVRRGSASTVHLAAHRWYRRAAPRANVVIDEIHGIPFCLAAYTGVPVIGWIYEIARNIWFRMYPPPIALMGHSIEAVALRWYVRRSVPFITDSRSTAADLCGIGADPSLVTVIEPAINGIPLAALPHKEDRPTVIFVGRLVRMKGIEDALRAAARVRSRLAGCQFWILGTGSDEYVRSLRGLADELGISAAVRFFGWIEGDNKFALMGRAHVLIHPSQREGWGMNVVEANAMGTPAVGYRVQGLRDSIVDGKTGVLCPYGDVSALANAICSLLTDPPRYQAMRHAAIEWSKRFDWDRAAVRSLRVLENACGGIG